MSAYSTIIAIDGPAAAGKGTLARRLAAHFDFAFLDTGAIYRATGLAVLRAGGDPHAEADALAAAHALDPAMFSDPAIREESSGQAASAVAAIASVRAALLEFQRTFAHHPPLGKKGAVLDGRDIGTVVCPDATAKLFITASLDIRARRRFQELQEKGLEVIWGRVLEDMRARDARDSGRDTAPLTAAKDAFVLDTTDLDADAAFAAGLAYVVSRLDPP